jgi:hypothetical protein
MTEQDVEDMIPDSIINTPPPLDRLPSITAIADKAMAAIPPGANGALIVIANETEAGAVFARKHKGGFEYGVWIAKEWKGSLNYGAVVKYVF